MAKVYAMVGVVGSLILIGLAWHWSLLWAVESPSEIGPLLRAEGGPLEVRSLGLTQKLNWLLYPLFYLLVAWLVGVTWNSFSTAWHGLEKSGVVSAPLPDNGPQPVLQLLRRRRRYCIAAALAVGFLITFVDTACLAKHYWPDAVPRFWPAFSHSECFPEVDFFTAYQRPDSYSGIPADFRQANLVYTIAWYILQALLISGAFLALFQVCLHQIVFMQLRSGRTAAKWGLPRPARIDPFDRLRESGLHSWNHVLNYSYFAIAICMIIPIISHWYQPEEEADIGQVMLQIFLPLLFLVPLILGVVARQLYLDDLKQRIARVAKRLNQEQIALFHDQALWPFDRSILGKGAFSVILIEYGIVASNAHDLIKLSIKSVAA